MDSQSKGTYTYIADVVDYKEGRLFAEMRNRFKEGDVLQVLSPTDTFGKEFTVKNLTDSKGESTQDAKLVQEIYQMDSPYTLKKGDYLRRK